MKNKASLQIEDRGEERDTIELETQRDLLAATLNIDGDTVNESYSPITEKQDLDQDQTVQFGDVGYRVIFTEEDKERYCLADPKTTEKRKEKMDKIEVELNDPKTQEERKEKMDKIEVKLKHVFRVYKKMSEDEKEQEIEQRCVNILRDPADVKKLYVVVDERFVLLINTESKKCSKIECRAPDKIQCLKFVSDAVKHTESGTYENGIFWIGPQDKIPTQSTEADEIEWTEAQDQKRTVKHKLFLIQSEDKTLKILDEKTNRQLFECKAKATIQSLTISNDETYLYVYDRCCNFYKLALPKTSQRIKVMTGMVDITECPQFPTYYVAFKNKIKKIDSQTFEEISEYELSQLPKKNITKIIAYHNKKEKEKGIFVLENEKNDDNITFTSTLHYLDDKIFKAKDKQDGKMNKEKDNYQEKPHEINDLRAPSSMGLDDEGSLIISVNPKDSLPQNQMFKIVKGTIVNYPSEQFHRRNNGSGNARLEKDSIILGLCENSQNDQVIFGYQQKKKDGQKKKKGDDQKKDKGDDQKKDKGNDIEKNKGDDQKKDKGDVIEKDKGDVIEEDKGNVIEEDKGEDFFVRIFENEFKVIKTPPRKMIAVEYAYKYEKKKLFKYNRFLLIMDPESQTGELIHNDYQNNTNETMRKYKNLKDATLIEHGEGPPLLLRVESDKLILSIITAADEQIVFEHQLDQKKKPKQIFCHSDKQRIFIKYEDEGEVDLIELDQFQEKEGEYVLNQGLLFHLMKKFLHSKKDDDRNLYFSHLPFNGQISMGMNMLTLASIYGSQEDTFDFLIQKKVAYQLNSKGQSPLQFWKSQKLMEFSASQKQISYQDTLIMLKNKKMRDDLTQFISPVYSKLEGYKEDIIEGYIWKSRIYSSDPKITESMIGGIEIKKNDWRYHGYGAQEIKMESFKIPIINNIMSPLCKTDLTDFKKLSQSQHEQSNQKIIVKDIFQIYKKELVLFNLPYLINAILLSIYIIWHSKGVLYAMVVVSSWLVVVQYLSFKNTWFELVEYLFTPYNYVELGGPLSVLFFLAYRSKNAELVGAVMIFTKALQSMRIIDDYRFLTNLIVKCLFKMIPFMVLFFQIILMFSILNYIEPYQKEGEEEGTLVDLSYPVTLTNQYRVVFGNNPDPIYTSQWVFYIIFTQFAIVLNLNLLVAIISDAYQEVQDAKESTDLVEMINMLLELRSFKSTVLKIFRGEDYAKEVTFPEVYMHSFTYLSQMKDGQDDEWLGGVKALTNQVVNLETQIKGIREEINTNTDKKINDLSSEINANTDKINDLSSKMDARMDTIVKLLEEKN